jgi:hypothetical protein
LPREEKNCYSLTQNAIYAVLKSKETYVFFKSNSDSKIFIPRFVKAGLYINFKINTNTNKSQRETIPCYSRSENPTYAVPKNKVPYLFFEIKF